MARVLVVDDDAHIQEVMRFALERAGFEVLLADDGREALAVAQREAPDLIVLDILMPELDGTDVCRQLRQTSSVPIIFVSSLDDDVDRILGLELGGDDYLTKPFVPRELVARCRAVLRRSSGNASGTGADSGRLVCGALTLDLRAYTAIWRERAVPLTVVEFGLLRTLVSQPDKVFSRAELMRQAYEGQAVVSDRTIDSHVRRLRKKFAAQGAELIETAHGFGYKLAVTE